MKLWTPEVFWHGKLRVLSLDLYPKPIICDNESIVWKLATAGADNDVKIWHVTVSARSLEFRASLDRHNSAVNVVRFSPSGEFLASGSDDCSIMLWKFNEDKPIQKQMLKDDGELNKENWSVVKILGGHAVGVFDLSWSPDTNFIVSGGIDNRAIVWDIKKGKMLSTFCESNNYVQGVAWDPKNQYVATLSNDSFCRIYSVLSKKPIHQIYKCNLGRENLEAKPLRMSFEGSTLESFFRRLAFSPDGSLLIVPSGRLEGDGSTLNTTFVFNRTALGKPAVYLPSPAKPTVAVRCCPVLFQLRHNAASNNSKMLFKLPYRMVFAVATLETVLLYDTQQTLPIAMIGKIHYAALTDLTWSTDGQLLVISSSDGYCSLVEFADEELGVPLTPAELQQINKDTTTLPEASQCNLMSQQMTSMKLDKSSLVQHTTQGYPLMVASFWQASGAKLLQDFTTKPACGVTLVEPGMKRATLQVESSAPVSMATRPPVVTHIQPTNQSSPPQVSDHIISTIATPPSNDSSAAAPLESSQPMKMGPHTPNSQQQPVSVGNATPASGGQLKPRRLPLSALKAV